MSTGIFFAIVGVSLLVGVAVMIGLDVAGAPRPVRIGVGWICGAIAGICTAVLLGVPTPF